MSIHVCKCVHNGIEEYHLRYPGLTEKEAQQIADKINAGALESFHAEYLRLLGKKPEDE